MTPSAFAERWRALRRRLRDAGRAPDLAGRSVELDIALATPDEPGRAVDDFCAARGIGREHPLVATMLAGEPEVIAARIAEYAAAGATDLMLGFCDFPSTRMLERFALHVRPRLEALAQAAVLP